VVGTMASFQKPESALKRADELIEVGKQKDALETLKAAIENRRFKNMWTQTSEQIMLRHLMLCVELKKMRTAREGLHQYRQTCQGVNIASLEHVVQQFRKAAEDKVNEARKESEAKQLADMEDLDEMEAPQTILLRAIQAGDTRQQSQDKDIHSLYRFLWDTYKVILDVLKSNPLLEDVYHDTARRSFEFCRVNGRPQEFKRLCETLRKNWQDLSKRTVGPDTANRVTKNVNPNHPDTINRMLETRCKQLQIATELNLWREAYITADEVKELMSKNSKPKLHLRSLYYDYLGQIFMKSEDYLFHAFACLRNLMFVKAAKQNCPKEELEALASKAVLATLCVPFQKGADLHTTLELTTESASSPYEKAKKNASLFATQAVPTRDSIISQLQEKHLLSLASEPCQKLFELVEDDFTPLSLCQDAKPYLDEIAMHERLGSYSTPLKQIIFFRLMKQLSEVYANMTVENFERAASIVPFNIAEKWMANAAKSHGINIQINYREQAIVFGASRKVDMKSMRQPLIEIGYKLAQAMNRIAPDERQKKERLEKQQLSENIVRRIEEETQQIRQRKEEIERRKQEREKQKEDEDRRAADVLRKQEAKEAELERQREDEGRRKREQDKEEQRRRDAEMQKNKEMIEDMKRNNPNKAVKIGNKAITEITDEHLAKISVSDIHKARETQFQRERAEKVRQRKLESKRVDHLARALREEEAALLEKWRDDIEESDRALLAKIEEASTKDQREAHKNGLEEKELLLVFKSVKDDWVEKQLEAREEDFNNACDEREAKLAKQVVANKIDRARKRKKQHEAEMAKRQADEEREADERDRQERAERKRLEDEKRAEERRAAEEAERAERAEADRIQAEEDRRMAEERKAKREAERAEQSAAAERAQEKQRQREKDIEEKQQRENEERKAGRAAAAAGAGTSTGGAAAGTEGGAWRSRAPAGGSGGGWRDRLAAKEGGEKPPQTEESPWRKPGQKSEDKVEESPWRKSAAEDKPKTATAAPWRSRGSDNADSAPAPARRVERQPERQPERPAPAAREAPAPQPVAREEPPAPVEDEDGFQAVSGKKKKGGGGGATPAPWRKG